MDKSGKLPGEYTINGFIHRISEYPNEVESIQMVKDNVVHIGTNAKTKQKIEIAKKWALKAWEQVKGFTNEINALSAEYKNDAERELKEFKERPLWKKLFLN